MTRCAVRKYGAMLVPAPGPRAACQPRRAVSVRGESGTAFTPANPLGASREPGAEEVVLTGTEALTTLRSGAPRSRDEGSPRAAPATGRGERGVAQWPVSSADLRAARCLSSSESRLSVSITRVTSPWAQSIS